MCGIFAYLNFLTPKTRSEIIEILIQGLQRMEYRGYDSAGELLLLVASIVLITYLFQESPSMVVTTQTLHMMR